MIITLVKKISTLDEYFTTRGKQFLTLVIFSATLVKLFSTLV